MNCMISVSTLAQQTSKSEVIEASLKSNDETNPEANMRMLPFDNTAPKKNELILPDARGSIVSSEGKIVGRLKFTFGTVDRLENNNYRISNTGQVIDFSGNLIGYVHPKFIYNKTNISFEIY
jgi:hypothetical protein